MKTLLKTTVLASLLFNSLNRAALKVALAGVTSLLTKLALPTGASVAQADVRAPLVIQGQGSFAVGGTVIKNPGSFDQFKPSSEGQSLHGDHAYVYYQVPVHARPLPLVFWHGAGQSSKTWESTPDGREGFQNIFLRRGFPVYLLDQPAGARPDAVPCLSM